VVDEGFAMTFRYQIIEFATGDPEGVPYRYIGRALMRMWQLNAFERANRFTLRPVRSRE
jgi:hypothetical protein